MLKYWFKYVKSGVVMHTCNPSTSEAEAGMFQALLDYTLRPQKKSENSGVRMATGTFQNEGFLQSGMRVHFV